MKSGGTCVLWVEMQIPIAFWETNLAIYYFSLAVSLLGIKSVEIKGLACRSICTKIFL